jgi:hypothetical protein
VKALTSSGTAVFRSSILREREEKRLAYVERYWEQINAKSEQK